MSHVGKYTVRPMDVMGYSDTAKGQSESFFLFNQVFILKKRWGTEGFLLKEPPRRHLPPAIHGTRIFANIYHQKKQLFMYR